jgi:predicted aspartyl protease
VVFIGQEVTIDLICLVDSGADVSILSKEIAESLGLDLSGPVGIAYGVGGQVSTVDTHANIAIGMGTIVL